jgi:similar to spore coat protein
VIFLEQDLLALHETMETHELLNFKTVCLLRSKLMQGLCFDNELKALMEKDVQQSIQDVNELLGFYKRLPKIQ